MTALAIPTPRTRRVTEPRYCNCGEPLQTPYERRHDECLECEHTEARMVCVACEEYVGIAYSDGRPTFCSDSYQDAYWSCTIA